MEKIKMTTPLVELDGDEMTRILWADIKKELLEPYIDLKTVYFDLGLPERERTAGVDPAADDPTAVDPAGGDLAAIGRSDHDPAAPTTAEETS